MAQPTHEPAIVMYTTSWCGDCRRAKKWLNEHAVAYRDIDIDQDEAAAQVVMQINHGSRVIPTILFPDGSVLVEPSNRQLALKVEETLGVTSDDAQRAHAAGQQS